ncbi:hypothetical protein R6Q57_024081 [Mikania cordata]
MGRYYNNNNNMSYIRQLSIPIHFFFFIFVVFVFLCFTWYINYESKVESFVHRLKLILTFTPIVLLVLVRWLSSGERAWVSSSLVLFPEKDSLHRAGGFMISNRHNSTSIIDKVPRSESDIIISQFPICPLDQNVQMVSIGVNHGRSARNRIQLWPARP